MSEVDNSLEFVSPEPVLRQIVSAVPEDCRKYLVIIGSLAVGYHYFGTKAGMFVRTKDADCLLSPRVQAIPTGKAITERLLDEKWKRRADGWRDPGDANTPVDRLPAVRLHPPGTSNWFIELLAVPASSDERGKRWERLPTKYGHFGLCSFSFLLLTDYEPIETELGIYIARPEMMALANLLEHPEIKPETMSAGFAGRTDIKRSNKDLGRVIAIAMLASEKEESACETWPDAWNDALRNRFAQAWSNLASRVGNGIRAILSSEEDLEQAYHTCVNGLLAARQLTLEEFRIAAQRLIQDAIEPTERSSEE